MSSKIFSEGKCVLIGKVLATKATCRSGGRCARGRGCRRGRRAGRPGGGSADAFGRPRLEARDLELRVAADVVVGQSGVGATVRVVEGLGPGPGGVHRSGHLGGAGHVGLARGQIPDDRVGEGGGGLEQVVPDAAIVVARLHDRSAELIEGRAGLQTVADVVDHDRAPEEIVLREDDLVLVVVVTAAGCLAGVGVDVCFHYGSAQVIGVEGHVAV